MFEIVGRKTVDFITAANDETEHPMHSIIEVANRRMTDASPRKIVLPRRLGASRFGPQPYYYEASRTGVLPSGCVSS